MTLMVICEPRQPCQLSDGTEGTHERNSASVHTSEDLPKIPAARSSSLVWCLQAHMMDACEREDKS